MVLQHLATGVVIPENRSRAAKPANPGHATSRIAGLAPRYGNPSPGPCHHTLLREEHRSDVYSTKPVEDQPNKFGPGDRTPTTEPAIEVRDLTKTYPGDVRALEGLSFAVEPGTVFGLLGPNGAGKSTTVKILTTLSRPDAGEARVAGLDVLKQPDQVRHAIGCVAQRSGADL